ncbi:TIGR04283 family arsenosugar biosynthesis glycosyltransferase [Roseiconus lacunae]|uniref:TIGR04283 family arsenosugar biosynthesis glycosyltransferase n=1 Tax=Roseiconus lacunae TaxID=2605694 RepID=UPI001E5FB9B4|nr:TIGR04283 family arsenosugar biosynthesis glycosyltransferase [Roseiconus lacunae]MCD0459746.1 TIGR04283 family arsenosugar biosynthesis glycosyltransferase [Roseiconus lacunae]
MAPQDFSVVIATLNEAENVSRSVESAFRCNAGEVIVVDGGSGDSTVAIAKRSGAKVITSERGRGMQLRRGAERARGRMVLFLHADNWLDRECLTTACRLYDIQPDCDVFWGGFRQRIEADGMAYRMLEVGNAMRIRLRGIPFGDQAIFVQRSLYDIVGGVQPLPLMEDVVLAQCLRRHRWPTLVDATVHVDPRRWQRRGVIRQTVRNWGIQTAHCLGISEGRLSQWYR